MNIYVASSWRNTHQPAVVRALRARKHEVYDFKDSEGFHWSEVDPNWQHWTPNEYLNGLEKPTAVRGFNRDFTAMKNADCCVYVMPCGVSASIEMGWFAGQGKPVIVYVPELCEPDLMVKVATHCLEHLESVVRTCDSISAELARKEWERSGKI